MLAELLDRLANLQAKMKATPKGERVAAAAEYKGAMADIRKQLEETEKATDNSGSDSGNMEVEEESEPSLVGDTAGPETASAATAGPEAAPAEKAGP